MKTQYVVLTDLDGTLLDHHTYQWQAAKPALDRLKDLSIPVIINTSKTQAEVEALAQEIGLTDQPFAVENGSALLLTGFFSSFISDLSKNSNYKILNDTPAYVIGESINNLHNYMDKLPAELTDAMESYRQWSVETLAETTGLNLEQATASKAKLFSEPFIWHGNDALFNDLNTMVDAAGFSILKGGRFYHLQGPVTKASVIDFLQQNFKLFWPQADELKIIALGDNDNDIAMLDRADFGICIKSPVSDFPAISNEHAIYSDLYGPEGWNAEINQLLNTLNI